jgi:transglutaminase-like putative cysteine protease
MKTFQIFFLGLLVSLVSCQLGSGSKEHKETREHSEKQTSKIDIADIETGIKSYIEDKSNEEGGYFHIKDDSLELRLKLVRVHTEYLSNLGPQRHFACVDLADVSGDVYDVDFFLEGDPGNMTVTETTVHKLNGKPFYTWKQHEDKTWHRVSVKSASTELLGVIEGEDEFEFHYEVRLPEITEEAKMWIPIAKSNRFQTVELISLNAPGKQEMLKEKEFGNTILFLKLNPEHSGKAVKVNYSVKRKEKGPYEDHKSVPEMYLASNLLVPVGGRFNNIVNEALEGKHEDSKLIQARALYDYIIDNMQYKKAGEYGTGDANYACDSRRGNCTEFHSFFISLARSAGIPARFSIGAAIPSERNEGGVDGYHCWAEFYAEGKWWPVDISEGNKYTALATYYFGHHPANRIELSRGRDLKVEPGPLSGPINFLAYPVLEIGGQPATVETTFSFNRKTTAGMVSSKI